MSKVSGICEHLRSVVDSDELFRLEDALTITDRQVVKLFHAMSANEVFEHRAARNAVQSRLNRLRSAHNRKPAT